MIEFARRIVTLTDAEAEAEYRAIRESLADDYQHVTARGRRADDHHIGVLRGVGRTDQADRIERASEERVAAYHTGANRKWLLAIRTGRYDRRLDGCASGDPGMQAAIDMLTAARQS